jgi:hypothetical protein
MDFSRGSLRDLFFEILTARVSVNGSWSDVERAHCAPQHWQTEGVGNIGKLVSVESLAKPTSSGERIAASRGRAAF